MTPMYRRALFAAVLLVLGMTPPVAQPSPDPATPPAAADPADNATTEERERRLAAQNRLAARLVAIIEQDRKNENIVISPASVALVLALLDIGADDNLRLA